MEENRERERRLEKARQRKKECLERLARRKEIVVLREGKSEKWIKRKQQQWREFRTKSEINFEDENELRNKIILKIPERVIKSDEKVTKTLSDPHPPTSDP